MGSSYSIYCSARNSLRWSQNLCFSLLPCHILPLSSGQLTSTHWHFQHASANTYKLRWGKSLFLSATTTLTKVFSTHQGDWWDCWWLTLVPWNLRHIGISVLWVRPKMIEVFTMYFVFQPTINPFFGCSYGCLASIHWKYMAFLCAITIGLSLGCMSSFKKVVYWFLFTFSAHPPMGAKRSKLRSFQENSFCLGFRYQLLSSACHFPTWLSHGGVQPPHDYIFIYNMFLFNTY